MVDDARMGGLPQDGLLECGVVTGLGNAVEDGTEKYVVALGLALCYLCKTVARSGKAAVEGGGGLGTATVEVNAVEGKLFDKVEMVVEHDATKPLSRNGGKKLSDGVCRGGGLAHMEQVDAAAEEGVDGRNLSRQKVGRGDDNPFHRLQDEDGWLFLEFLDNLVGNALS